MIIPENRRLQTGKEISDYVYGKFFTCVRPFLSWLKKGEAYWFEYHPENDKYEVRSDNALGKEFEMTTHQLLTCFVPTEIESNVCEAYRYFHWLGELGIHHGYVDEIADWYYRGRGIEC